MSNTEEQFYNIAQDAISRAMKVDCDIAEYIQGLQGMIDEMYTAKDAAEQDLKAMESQ